MYNNIFLFEGNIGFRHVRCGAPTIFSVRLGIINHLIFWFSFSLGLPRNRFTVFKCFPPAYFPLHRILPFFLVDGKETTTFNLSTLVNTLNYALVGSLDLSQGTLWRGKKKMRPQCLWQVLCTQQIWGWLSLSLLSLMQFALWFFCNAGEVRNPTINIWPFALPSSYSYP